MIFNISHISTIEILSLSSLSPISPFAFQNSAFPSSNISHNKKFVVPKLLHTKVIKRGRNEKSNQFRKRLSGSHEIFVIKTNMAALRRTTQFGGHQRMRPWITLRFFCRCETFKRAKDEEWVTTRV